MSAPSRHTGKLLTAMTVVGLGGAAATFVVEGAPRFWTNYLVWFLFLLTLGLGALFMVALDHLVGTVWSVPVRRVPERLASFVLLAAPLALFALLSLNVIYPWNQPAAAANPILVGKAVWLNVPFFAARVVICLVLWLVSYRVLVGGSLRQDSSKDPLISVRSKRFAPLFMAIFAFTVTVLAFDWISSLEPEWYSDIFGVYIFAGAFLAGLASSTLAILHLVNRGRLPDVRPDHLYNLGGLMFAFTVFWSYIGFAQYMLIWYSNMPEEVGWYQERLHGGWQVAALLLALFHFVIPFFALLARDAKSKPGRLARVAVVALFAHLLDLYWMVYPTLGRGPMPGWPELAFALLFIGGGLLWARQAMARGADMPVGDPFLKQGLEFHL
ncbi:MAG: hypothetical protein ACYC8T_16930 [Myxococcaceae bacterium]